MEAPSWHRCHGSLKSPNCQRIVLFTGWSPFVMFCSDLIPSKHPDAGKTSPANRYRRRTSRRPSLSPQPVAHALRGQEPDQLLQPPARAPGAATLSATRYVAGRGAAGPRAATEAVPPRACRPEVKLDRGWSLKSLVCNCQRSRRGRLQGDTQGRLWKGIRS